ncbi:MAG: phosphate ABC transporter permease PstA [Eubacteriales bacterium]|nr:phosphate ABC transporter permease PstA [Eubacteriales bacterium]
MQIDTTAEADMMTEPKKRNASSVLTRLKSYVNHPGSGILALLTGLAALATFALLFFLIGYILVKGVPYLTADLFSLEYTSENVSLVPSLINTLTMTVVSLLIAAPLGIFAAIYLVEYAKKGSRLVNMIRITAETLSGIPSIVYGLFGMLFFVTTLKWGMSLLSGAFTMVIMVLPLIMRTSEEALKSVPDSYREASFGLGAGKLRTIFSIVLPSAVPGILAGVILAIGRVIGETAALIYTAGTVAAVPDSLMGSGRTLALHMYVLSSEGLHMNQASATAVVILAFVLVINALSGMAAKRIAKG